MQPFAINFQTAPGTSNLMRAAGWGAVRFVDSGGGGSTTSGGRSPTSAFTLLDNAFDSGVTTASKGDVVYVMPGHAETVTAANGIDIDIAGVTVQGLGNGTNKPTITMGTATTATVRINAANVTLKNIRFVGNIDSLVKFIDVNATYCTIEDCIFVTSSTKEATSFINLADTIDYLTVRRCRFEQPTDPDGTDDAADTGCFFFADSEYILIEDCWFYGNFETAIFHNRTTAAKNVWVRNCFGTQLLSTGLIYTQVAAMEGGNINSTWNHRTAADVTEATWTGTASANFVFDRNSGVLADGAAGGQYAAAGTADNS